MRTIMMTTMAVVLIPTQVPPVGLTIPGLARVSIDGLELPENGVLIDPRPISGGITVRLDYTAGGCTVIRFEELIARSMWVDLSQFSTSPPCAFEWRCTAPAKDGDCNRSGSVNNADITFVRSCLGQPVAGRCAVCDLDRDNDVDGDDVDFVRQRIGQ